MHDYCWISLRRDAVIAWFLLAFAATAYPADFPGLNVKEVAFSTHVDEQKNYVKPKIDVESTRISKGPIFLWTVLTGTQETLDALKEETYWPVRHKWIYRGAARPPNQPEDVGHGNEEDDPPDVSKRGEELAVGRIKNKKGLQDEINSSENGQFDWRTWSFKAWLPPGEYELVVEIRGGGRILEMPGNKKCEFRFTVY